jgi:hypothetical protein
MNMFSKKPAAIARHRRTLTAIATAAASIVIVSVLTHQTVADDKPAATPASQPATAPAPDYSAYSQSYHIPFGNPKPVDFDHLTTMEVRVSIDGGPPLRLQVDTGSWGVIVGADHVKNIDPNAPAGSIVYSSSGNELDGVWTTATLTFPDSKDEHGNVATAVVPILAATEYKFHPGAVNGGPAKSTTAPSKAAAANKAKKYPQAFMLGIGTGRGPEVHQERNPWVNLNEMKAGTMRRGYTITSDGITLGLTGAGTKGFQFQKLNQHVASPSTKPVEPTLQPSPKDWDSSFGWISIDGKMQQKSWMLLDTGLTNFMIEYPQTTEITQVPAGTDVTVGLLGGQLSYSFKTGDKANPNTPSKVSFVHREGYPMINTGLRALAHFDYLLDSDGGYFGLRPRSNEK